MTQYTAEEEKVVRQWLVGHRSTLVLKSINPLDKEQLEEGVKMLAPLLAAAREPYVVEELGPFPYEAAFKLLDGSVHRVMAGQVLKVWSNNEVQVS